MGLDFQNTIESIGGGGMGGFGGLGGSNGFGGAGFLTLLILFGLFGGDFGNRRRDGDGAGGAGVLAGATQAKLDCLERGQSELSQQIAFNRSNDQFSGLSGQIYDLAGIQRDSTAALAAQTNDLRSSFASCCCDLKVGQQAIQTSVAAQTAALLSAGKDNTQKILDKLCDTQIQALQTENNRLVNAANTNSVIAAILAQCGNNGGSGCGGGCYPYSSINNVIRAQPVPQTA